MTDKGRILTVDDTPASLKLLTDMLRGEGYEVRAAISGELALNAATSDPPDLVLLDIRMPDMDGYEVCRRLKAQSETREVPVIFVSAASETGEKVKGFEIGAVDYVTKPYQREELLARVRTHLELHQLRNHFEDLVKTRTIERDQALELAQAGHWTIDFSEGDEYYISSARTVEIFGDPSRKDYRYHIMNDWYVNLEAADKELADATLANYQAAVAGTVPRYDMVHPYKRPVDGRIVWVHVLGHIIRDQQGKPTHVYGVVMDVTQQKIFEQELERQAHVDYLTGLSNRGHFIHEAELELARAIRYQNNLSLLMMDIDHFKRINDTYGHKAGDLVLRKLADVCRSTLREVDIIGRIGGEEFAILLPETSREKAAEVAERIRDAIASSKVDLASGRVISFTVSIGISAMTSPDDTLDLILNIADKRLYVAKNAGRNQVSVTN